MKSVFIQAAMYLAAMTVSFAQGSLFGTVKDLNGIPIADVNVYISSIGKGEITDKLGRFSFNGLKQGSYQVSVSHIGFRTQQHNINIGTVDVLLNIILEGGQLTLSDVVITDQMSQGTNTISQVDIRLRPVNTSQDILRMIPGLFIAQHAGGGKAEQIFLRGFDIDHGTDINLEVDGLPVNMPSHAHGQGYSDLHFLIPEITGRVDFDKGPYYADKGNFTTAGFAAFHTKSSLDQNMVKVEGGRFGTFRNVNALTLFSESEGAWQSNAYIASEYFRTDGFFDANQHFNRINLQAKYHASRGDRESLTIGVSTFNSGWDASGQIPDRAVADGIISRFGSIDPTEGGETSRTNIWTKHIIAQQNGGVFENQFYYSKYDFNLVSNFTFFLHDAVNGDQITQSESRNIYGYKGIFSIEKTVGGLSITTEAGAGFRYDDVNDLHLYHTQSRKQFLNDVVRGDVDETNLYAYISETIALTPRLVVNGALRFDHFTFNYVDALTPDFKRQSISKPLAAPKLNINYQVGRNINLFVKSGIGFHSNDTRVVVAQQGRETLPRAYGADIGADVKAGQSLFVHAALWILDLDQEFVYVGDEGIVEPSGKTRRQGIDVSVRYQPLSWLFIDTDVNVTKPRAKGAPPSEDYIPLAPTFTSIGGVSAKLKNGLNASLRYRYLGDRPANEDYSVTAKGYFLVDGVLRYTRKSYELSVSAENILNVDWKEAQFDTESRLSGEASPVSEIHFTPGTPAFFRMGLSVFF